MAISFVSFLGIQSASAIEGLTVGVAMNKTAAMGTGKETMKGSGAATGQLDITEEEGAFEADVASAFVEFAVNDTVSVGVERMLEDMTTPENKNIQNADHSGTEVSNTVKATFKDHTTIYANVNMPLNTYLKFGYVMVDVLTQEKLGTGSKYNDVDTNGFQIGLGYQFTADNGVFVRAEVSATQYDDVSATSTVDSAKSVEVSEMYGAIGGLKIGKTF